MMAKSVYKTVIFGAGQIGQMTARLLSSPCQLLCFADNDPHKHGSYIGNIPVCSPDAAAALLPDLVILGVLDEERRNSMIKQMENLGYHGPFRDPSVLRMFVTEALARIEKPLEEQYFAARQASADLAKEQEALRAELNAVSGGKWGYPHGDAATKVRDAVNAELKSRGMTADAKIFCELLTVADESWQDCVEACLGDRRFDILVPPAFITDCKSTV